MRSAVGVKTAGNAPPLIALLGNPNTGKSSVFNRLTGLSQRVANYPGITVEKKIGTMVLAGVGATVLDLPGSYSLAASSPEERVVIDVLSGEDDQERPDLVLTIVDATQLKRNLFLASQAAEFDLPMILVLNQWDVAQRNGITIDLALLEERLGVPVIPTVATSGEGIPQLRDAIRKALRERPRMHRIRWPDPLPEIEAEIGRVAARHGQRLTFPEIQRLLFDPRSAVESRLHLPKEETRELLDAARGRLRAAGLNPGAIEAVWQYEHIDRLLEGVVEQGTHRTRQATESIDRLLLHKFWGTIIFLAIMWVVFQSVYSWAGPLMDLIDAVTRATQIAVAPRLEHLPMLRSLLLDGVIAGVGGVVNFVPQIAILFLFIGILEDTGYMARAAFLMDKLFGWCGLSGKSFVPLLSCYACAIPGILSARSIEDPKARITTIMMAPLMSCSARLPVYVLLIGAFIEPVYGAFVAGWALFAMHFVGLLVSLPLSWATNRFFLKTEPLPFLLEMPPYKIPNARNLFLRTWGGGREFLLRAGTVILAFSIVIWALLYFPHDPRVEAETTRIFLAEGGGARPDAAVALHNRIDGAYVEDSYMGRIGKTIQPVFAPAGFDWKITVSVLASFPAREVLIATMGIIYNLGAEVDEQSEGLRGIMAQERWPDGPRAGQLVYTPPVVVGIMVFFALCLQCGSTVAVIAKELDWRWAASAFFGMSGMAWCAAVVIYQVGTWILE